MKILKTILLIISTLVLALVCYFFVGFAPDQKNVTWGIDFSQMQAEALALEWKEVYISIMDDLGAKNIKLHTQWDWVEGEKGDYFFHDIDWQIQQAEQRNVKIIYVVGLKTGRWPECHIPTWAGSLSEKDQKEALREYITKVVQRYKNSKAIVYWQVENEPLFRFGECPSWYYNSSNFLQEEVDLVRSLDNTRPIVISDTGEYSSWLGAAKIGDIVGITTYRNAWAHISDTKGFYFNSIVPPVFYWRRAEIIRLFLDKKVIGVELQAEPWVSRPFYDVPLQEQEKSMNVDKFKENILFAKKTGLDTFYFWGAEWWYWLKETQDKPEIWDEAKTLFQ